MDVFVNMPLNKAHLLERKAEQCIDRGDEEGALTNFEEARKYMLKAMETTKCVESLQSMHMQCEAYLKRCELVVMEREIKQKQGNVTDTDGVSEPTDETKSSNKVTEERDFQSNLSHNEKLIKTEHFLEYEREPDSLLQFRNPRNDFAERKNRKKCPKADSDVIEELQTRNKCLEDTLKIYMDKQEQLENENRALKKQVNSLECELKKMKKKKSSDGDSPSLYENYKTPHFVLDQDIGPASIVQQQSFFDFDDPIIAIQLQNAIEEEPAVQTNLSQSFSQTTNTAGSKGASSNAAWCGDVINDSNRMHESIRYVEVDEN